MASSPSSSLSSTLVNKRLQDVLISHECSLSKLNLSSIAIHRHHQHQQKQHHHHHQQEGGGGAVKLQNEALGAIETTAKDEKKQQQQQQQQQEQQQQEQQQQQSLAQAALYRSSQPQPPFQHHHHGHYENGNETTTIADLNLNPPERVSPQDLLIHDKSLSARNADNDGVGIMGIGIGIGAGIGANMGINMNMGSKSPNSDSIDVSSLTLKTITVLSTLCDEAHELHSIAKYKLIPKIHLFAHDLRYLYADANMNMNHINKNNIHMNNTNSGRRKHHHQGGGSDDDETPLVLDENILAERDSKLLHRMSKFITSLQSTQNFVFRCHRLIRNMICQLHGCLSPIVLYDDDDDSDIIENESMSIPSSVHLHEGDDTTNATNATNTSVPKFIGKHKTSAAAAAAAATAAATKDKGVPNNKNNGKQPKISFPPLFRKSYHLITLGEAISKLLSTLITLDAIIANNAELHEAWDLYKSIVTERAEKEEKVASYAAANAIANANANANANATYTTNSSNISPINDDYEESRTNLIRLERMIMQIDFTLLSSRSFLICIEQNFDPRGRFCFNPLFDGTISNQGKSNNRKRLGSNGNSSSSAVVLESKPLYEHVKVILTTLYERYCTILDTSRETTEREGIVGIYGLYCLYRRLVPSNKVPDDKLHKSLCTVFPSVCPIVPLFGNVPFMPIDFITKYAPLDIARGIVGVGVRARARAPTREEIIAGAKEVVEKQDKTFCKKVSLLYEEALAWLLQADTELAPSERLSNTTLFDDDTASTQRNNMVLTPLDQEDTHAMKAVKYKTDLILEGLTIGRRATVLLRNYLFLHTLLHMPIRSKDMLAIEQLCSIAKSVAKTLKVSRRSTIISIHKAGLKMIASSLYSCFEKLRSYIDQRSVDHGKDTADHMHVSTISTSLWALESILKGTSTFSPSRRYAIEVAVHACSQENFRCISSETMNSIDVLLNQLKLFSDIDDNVTEGCDCSFLYFNKEVYPVLIKYLYSRTEHLECERIQLVMSAFSDASSMLRTSSYFDSSHYLKQYREFVIQDVFNREFLLPLCIEIESSLRLLLFARNVDEMKPINPKEQKFGRFRKYVEMPPIHICGVTIYAKRIIQRYLERSFYNFSTVGLRDSKTYAEMAILGRELYGLSLIENDLPTENTQGVDLTELLDVQVFSKRYNYNMVQQNFVERKSNDGCKYLKTLGIETISLSFRRHGMGIAKNLIDEVVHFLFKSFGELTKMFTDNLFRSLLSKESRWFEQGNSDDRVEAVKYSFERAMLLRREISKLGDDNDEDDVAVSIDILEQCRECITRIGNVLGLARLIRSGKMYTTNQTKKYFSSLLLSPPSHEESSDNDNDDILHSMVNSLKKGIISTGNSTGADTTTILQNFYILFPALSLTWLDTSVRGKEMLNKKFQTFDAYYTDDGFAMGTAFTMEVLNQSAALDSLKWFESCCVSFAMNRQELKGNLKKEIQSNSNSSGSLLPFGSSKQTGEKKSTDGSGSSSSGDNELSRMRVMVKRLEARKQEMELLQYSVLGARVFFTCPAQN